MYFKNSTKFVTPEQSLVILLIFLPVQTNVLTPSRQWRYFIEWCLKASTLESEFPISNSAFDTYQLTSLQLSLLICKMTIILLSILHRFFLELSEIICIQFLIMVSVTNEFYTWSIPLHQCWGPLYFLQVQKWLLHQTSLQLTC